MFQPFERTGDAKEDAGLFLELASFYLHDMSSPFSTPGILANMAALLWWYYGDVNWVGFYLFDESCGELVLGPFMGEPACERIRLGRGVCGVAAEGRRSIVVDDVSTFDGHIACSSSSRSEMVVPIILQDGRLFGLIDADSPRINGFSKDDLSVAEEIAKLIVAQNPVYGYPLANGIDGDE